MNVKIIEIQHNEKQNIKLLYLYNLKAVPI